MRPSTILTCRTPNATGSTPRSGALATVPVLALIRSTMTNSSAEASGPDGVRAISSASLTMSMSSRIRMLVISESDPARMTMTVSAAPVFAIVARNPSAIDSTATSTPTTPTMPTTATADGPRRAGRVRRLTRVTATD